MNSLKKAEAIDLANSAKEIYSKANPDHDIQVNIVAQKRKMPLEPNIMVFQAFAYLASTRLKPSSNKVLMYLFSRSVYENFIGMDVKTMCDNLGMSKSSVISALKELEDYRIILKTKNSTDSRRHDYFINPTAAWKGNSFQQHKAVKKLSSVTQIQMFSDEHSL